MVGDRNLKGGHTTDNLFLKGKRLYLIRFLESLQDYFISVGRSDGIFVRDVSTAQRKWIYGVLEEKGFEKKRLYRLKTTFSKR